jgi:hypothetical protein
MIDILMMIFFTGGWRLIPNMHTTRDVPCTAFVLLLNADRWVAPILSDDECLNQPGGISADVCTALQ